MVAREMLGHPTQYLSRGAEKMDFHADIYELDNGRIQVALRGDAMGTAEFADSEVFAKFVAQCQEYIEDSRHAKNIMASLAKHNRQSGHATSDASADTSDNQGDHQMPSPSCQ